MSASDASAGWSRGGRESPCSEERVLVGRKKKRREAGRQRQKRTLFQARQVKLWDVGELFLEELQGGRRKFMLFRGGRRREEMDTETKDSREWEEERERERRREREREEMSTQTGRKTGKEESRKAGRQGDRQTRETDGWRDRERRSREDKEMAKKRRNKR